MEARGIAYCATNATTAHLDKPSAVRKSMREVKRSYSDQLTRC